MAIELKLYKTDNSPWGFRLTGGADCEVPLTVIKVVEGSIADKNGLQVGDVIVRINEYSVADYTHEEVHELMSEAGQSLNFGVRRDYYTDDEDENNNLEVFNIMKTTCEDTKLNEHNKYESSIPSETDELIAEAISGETEVIPDQNVLGVNFNKIDLSQSTVLKEMDQQKFDEDTKLEDRKWSTFLQKPQRPIMKPKEKSVEESKASPYQVVIKKQKRRIATDAETILCESELQEDVDQNQHNISDDNEPEQLENVEMVENHETLDEELNSNVDDNESDQIEDDNEDDRNENEPVEDHNVNEEPEIPLSTDEQLAELQIKLQALAQLPSSVQDTLESLTMQLAKILNVTQLQTHDEQNLSSPDISRDDSVDENYNAAEEDAILEEEKEIDEDYKSNTSEISDRDEDFNAESEISNEEFQVEEEKLEPEIDEEELERLRMENDKAEQKERSTIVQEEFHQRRLEQRPTNPLAPVQRPIILPGGRKWSQPNDAMPVRRKKSSMSDEKITETLDLYSETIVGHTKGINFLKYQPPPKNLDYLQKSEVYKMIHDMDPPPKGIATRPEIVASEQDYYTKSRYDEVIKIFF